MSLNTGTTVGGFLTITDGVIADLIGYAAFETFGVVGMAAPSFSDGFAKLLPARALRRGVTVEKDDAGLLIDLYIIIEHGVNLATVSQNLIDRVRFVIENYTNQKISNISVHVQGVRVSREK
ncbi:MAG: Asp23/Gls24 family envelope stress response protein [Coriobacteriia bacterium]|nr:Asp23/Gls24 family envelope stress response protein [Coriobacteriia bacterium]